MSKSCALSAPAWPRSSPYAKRGELYNDYRRHFGKDDARVLVWKAPEIMNSSVDPRIIAEASESDPEAARAEYGAAVPNFAMTSPIS
jgi:hypothetical protein